MFIKFIRRSFSKHEKPIKLVSEIIKNNIPIKLDKRDTMMQDQNLECFIPYDRVISQIKLISLSKNFLDNLILNNSLDTYCDDCLSDKINIGLDKIQEFNQTNQSGLKISLNYNIDLRKVNFYINLYNIKNIVLMGIDPDRKKPKNLKLINYYTDIIINNSVSNKPIRADLVANRDNKNVMNQINDTYIYLLSQFEYSLIAKKNDSFKLLLNVEDEFNEEKESMEFCLNTINFKVETILSKVSMNEVMKNKNSNEDVSLQAISLVESFYKEGKMNFDLKIVDIDNFMNGNEIV
jgi:hypothetical protein